VQSSTCVPNPHHPLLLPLLTPIGNPDICPLWYERWELRARVTGCYVSPLTFFVFLGSIAGTLLFVALVWATVWLVRWLKQREMGWWRCWRRRQTEETRPLLEGSGDG
jgi:hypothetical protein